MVYCDERLLGWVGSRVVQGTHLQICTSSRSCNPFLSLVGGTPWTGFDLLRTFVLTKTETEETETEETEAGW